jgi:hypothetical protein
MQNAERLAKLSDYGLYKHSDKALTTRVEKLGNLEKYLNPSHSCFRSFHNIKPYGTSIHILP